MAIGVLKCKQAIWSEVFTDFFRGDQGPHIEARRRPPPPLPPAAPRRPLPSPKVKSSLSMSEGKRMVGQRNVTIHQSLDLIRSLLPIIMWRTRSKMHASHYSMISVAMRRWLPRGARNMEIEPSFFRFFSTTTQCDVMDVLFIFIHRKNNGEKKGLHPRFASLWL